MSSVAAARLTAYRSPASRCKELLLGPPLATSRLVQERLRKLVALAVFSTDAISSTAYGTEQIMLILVAADPVAADRLSRLWAELPLAVPLEVVHCPTATWWSAPPTRWGSGSGPTPS